MDISSRISNVTGLQFFQIIRYTALIAIGMMLAKSGISQTDIGMYETFLLLAGLFSMFWVQGIIKATLPLLTNATQPKQGQILFNVFIVLVSFSLLSAVVMLLTNNTITRHILSGGQVPAPFLLAIYLVVNSPAMLTEYIYLLNNEPRKILVYAGITFPLQALAIGLPPFFGHSIFVSLIALLAISGLRMLWLYGLLWKHSQFKIDFGIIKKISLVSWPIVLSTLLSTSAQYIDGFIITANFSAADFAIYRYGARELPLALLLANSLSMAMVPRFALSDLRSPLAEMRSEVYRLGMMLFPLTLLALPASHLLFPIFFSDAFADSATIFNIYLMLIISRLVFPQTILLGQGLNKTLLRASVLEIIINVGLSLWFVQIFGIYGVAYATFIAYLFEKTYLAVVCYVKLGIAPSEYLPLKQYIPFTALLIIMFIIVEFVIFK